MFLVLLSYLDFFSIALPDSMLGVAWPAMAVGVMVVAAALAIAALCLTAALLYIAMQMRRENDEPSYAAGRRSITEVPIGQCRR